MADRIGGTLHLDISEFSRAITEANRLIKENESQWRQSAVTLGDWTKSEEGLTSKLEAVNNQIEQQRKIMDLLNGKKQKTVELYGAESKEVEAVNAQIARYGKALDSSYKEQANLQKSLDKLNSEQAENTKETKENTTVSQKNSKAVKEQSEDYKDLSESVAYAKTSFTVLKGVLSDLISTGIKNAVAGLKNFVNLINTLPETTKQTRREMTQLKIAFNEAGFSANAVEETYSNFKAILGNTVSNVDNVLSIMANLSDNEKDLSKWTTTLTGVYAKLGKTFPTEELMKNIQQTSNSATMTENLTKVLQTAGVNTATFAKNLTSLTTAEERENYILDTLYTNYGALGVEYQNVNSQMIQAEKATTDYNLALAKFGNALEPIKTEFTQAKADILNALAEMLKGTEGAENDLAYNLGYMFGSVSNVFAQLKEIFKPAWENITESLRDWWSENKENIKGKVGTALKDSLGIDLETIKDALHAGIFVKLASAVVTAGGAGGSLRAIGVAMGTALLLGMTDQEKINSWCDEHLPSFLADVAKTFSKLFKTAFDGIVDIAEVFNDIFDSTQAKAEANVQGVKLGNEFSNAFKQALVDNAGDVNKAWKQALEEMGKEVVEIDEIVENAVSNIQPQSLKVGDLIKLQEAGATDEQIEQLLADYANAIEDNLKNTLGLAGKDLEQMQRDFAEMQNQQLLQYIYDTTGNAELTKAYASSLESGLSLAYDQTETTFGEKTAHLFNTFWQNIKAGALLVADYFSTGKNETTDIGENFIAGVENGMTEATSGLIDTANMSAEELIEAYKKKLGIHSPSTVAQEQIGKNVVLGIDNGIWNNIDVLRGTAQQSTQDVMNTVETSIEQAEREVVGVAKDSGETVIESFARGYEAGKEGLKKTVTTVVEESINEGTNEVDTSKSANTVVTDFANNVEKSDNKSKISSSVLNMINSALDSISFEEGEDSVQNLVDNLYNSLTNAFMNMGGWWAVAGVAIKFAQQALEMTDEELDEWAENVANTITEALMQIMADIPRLVKIIIKVIVALGKAIVQALPELLAMLPDIIEQIIAEILNSLPEFLEVGMMLLQGIIEGMIQAIAKIGDLLKRIGQGIINGFKKLFGIASPSKVFADEIGKNISLGIAKGISDNVSAINGALDDVETDISMQGATGVGGRAVVVNQYNTYSQSYSRYEMYKSKKELTKAVQGAV